MKPLHKTMVTMMIIIMVIMMAKEGRGSSPMSGCTEGRITYYTYNNNGQCSFGAIGGPTLKHTLIAAPNDAFFGTDGSKCGGM